jgi:hypothetical protein
VVTQIKGRRAISTPIHPGKLQGRGLDRLCGNDLLQRTLNPGDRKGICIDGYTFMLHALDLESTMWPIAVKTGGDLPILHKHACLPGTYWEVLVQDETGTLKPGKLVFADDLADGRTALAGSQKKGCR